MQRHSAGADFVMRWMQYDSLGRMILNAEPNTATNFATEPAKAGQMRAWRYAYDDAGDLVGTSDARGCGENIFYDGAGRIVAEDYSPCRSEQATYSVPVLGSARRQCAPGRPCPDPRGNGTEAYYVYDAPEVGQVGDPAAFTGRLAAIHDRGAHTRITYDGRGLVTDVARRIAAPGKPSDLLASRYASWWFQKHADFDDLGRLVSETTGADVPELLGRDGQSAYTLGYSARGLVTSIDGSYGPLVSRKAADADGAARSVQYGDLAATRADFDYDSKRRLAAYKLARVAAPVWTAGAPGYVPPAQGTTDQSTLEDVSFGYDTARLTTIKHAQPPSGTWPAGAGPMSRALAYDGFDRLTQVAYGAGTAAEAQVSPFAAEIAAGSRSPVPGRINLSRVGKQSFVYDWRGNSTLSFDDQSAFYDRSLGDIRYDQDHPNRVVSARRPCPRKGPCPSESEYLAALHDDAGNLSSLLVARAAGSCSDAQGRCTQRYVYDWDEVGKLARARRWDYASAAEDSYPAVPVAAPAADLTYAYSQGSRVLKSAVNDVGEARHTLEIFPSLRVNHARWDGVDYERTRATETAYVAGGLARVVYANALPTLSSGQQHVFLKMGDHLGSTSDVVDRETGELVERSMYQAYGAAESDYRPERWASFREDYRFTGKEEDIEVGLTYFGARYYHPLLGRWASADPLTVHAMGADLNPYAYVSGSPLTAIDAFGLDSSGCLGKEDCRKIANSQSSDGDASGVFQRGVGEPSGSGGSGKQPAAHSWAPSPPPPPRPIACPACAGAGGRWTDSPGIVTRWSPFGSGAQDATMIGAESYVADNQRDLLSQFFHDNPAAGPFLIGVSPFGIVGGALDAFDTGLSTGQRAAGALGAVFGIVPYFGGAIREGLGAFRSAAAAAEGLGSGRAYSVAFETTLEELGAGTRAAHFRAANTALSESMGAGTLEELGISVPKSNAGTILGESPQGWTWHHVPDQPGVMQLVPRAMHQGSTWRSLFHPGGVGGFKLWGLDF